MEEVIPNLILRFKTIMMKINCYFEQKYITREKKGCFHVRYFRVETCI